MQILNKKIFRRESPSLFIEYDSGEQISNFSSFQANSTSGVLTNADRCGIRQI